MTPVIFWQDCDGEPVLLQTLKKNSFSFSKSRKEYNRRVAGSLRSKTMMALVNFVSPNKTHFVNFFYSSMQQAVLGIAFTHTHTLPSRKCNRILYCSLKILVLGTISATKTCQSSCQNIPKGIKTLTKRRQNSCQN